LHARLVHPAKQRPPPSNKTNKGQQVSFEAISFRAGEGRLREDECHGLGICTLQGTIRNVSKAPQEMKLALEETKSSCSVGTASLQTGHSRGAWLLALTVLTAALAGLVVALSQCPFCLQSAPAASFHHAHRASLGAERGPRAGLVEWLQVMPVARSKVQMFALRHWPLSRDSQERNKCTIKWLGRETALWACKWGPIGVRMPKLNAV
jgi:hypothetical protein